MRQAAIGAIVGIQALIANPLTLAILFALMVVMLLPFIRRVFPLWIQLVTAAAFVWACFTAIGGVQDPRAVELNRAVVWATGRVLSSWLAVAVAQVGASFDHNRSAFGLVGMTIAAEIIFVFVVQFVRRHLATSAAWRTLYLALIPIRPLPPDALIWEGSPSPAQSFLLVTKRSAKPAEPVERVPWSAILAAVRRS